MLKRAREKGEQPPLCPLLSSAWTVPVGGPEKSIVVAGVQHAQQQMQQGVAAIPCPGAQCAWYHEEANQCGVLTMLDCLCEMSGGEGDDDGSEGAPEGGDDDGSRGQPLPVDQGSRQGGS
jgi:hypothetical protein